MLRRVLGAIVGRHEILRTTYAENGTEGGAVQIVHREIGLELPIIDLRRLGEESRQRQLEAWVAHLSRRPVDFETGPVFRLGLFRLAPAEHLLMFICHHIAFDGWSTGILVGELEGLYEAFRAGRPSPRPALALQYGDFARWQRRRLEGVGLANHLVYWREKLRDLEPETELPIDHQPPATPRYPAETLFFDLPVVLGEAVRRLAAEEGRTLFATLLAAFDVLLHHRGGREDLAVLSPFANRKIPEVEELIGNFFTFLPLRVRLEEGWSFRRLLAAVQETVLEAHVHSDAVPEEIRRGILARRQSPMGSGDAPQISRILFAMQNLPAVNRDFSGLELRMVPMGSERIRFDASFYVYETPEDNFLLRLKYTRELFDRATAESWWRDLVRLLDAATRDPDRRFDELLRR